MPQRSGGQCRNVKHVQILNEVFLIRNAMLHSLAAQQTDRKQTAHFQQHFAKRYCFSFGFPSRFR